MFHLFNSAGDESSYSSFWNIQNGFIEIGGFCIIVSCCFPRKIENINILNSLG